MADSKFGLPDLHPSEINDVISTYRDIYRSTIKVIAAKIRKRERGAASYIVTSEWAQRNLERGISTKILRTFICDASMHFNTEIDSVDISNQLLSSISISGQSKAIIRSITTDYMSKDPPKQFFEIWAEGKSIKVIDLNMIDLHGTVYSDESFGALSWSRKEDKIAYIAEKKSPRTDAFYPQKKTNDLYRLKQENVQIGNQFVYVEDWGETFSPKREPVIVVCRVRNPSLSVITDFPANLAPGQVIWDPKGEGLIGVGYLLEKRKLGLVYCTNRKSVIFYLTNDLKFSTLSDNGKAVHSPRFSPDGNYLIWLERPVGGAHHTGHSLVKCDWYSKEIVTVVDLVDTSIMTENGKEFHGIYSFSLPIRCWTSDSRFVLLSTAQPYRMNSYAIDIENGNIFDISTNDDTESIVVLDVSEENFALCNKTSFGLASVLSSIHIPSILRNPLKEPLWVPLTRFYPEPEKNIIVNFKVQYSSEPNDYCLATYYGPRGEINGSVPMILIPHGGPHVSVPSVFSPSMYFFTRTGFCVLLVHYHGSTGCGQRYLNALLGNVGTMDVFDCYTAMQAAFERFPWIDRSNVMLYGGSHGGFIVTHLSSKYPWDFKSVAALNPVTNLLTMTFETDIPDWTFAEAGLDYKGMLPAIEDDEIGRKLFDVSPIKNIRKVIAPTLLLIGKNDLRVPRSQGTCYHNLLRELNVPTKMLLYDDNHSLATVPVEMDSMINTILWFKKCIKMLDHAAGSVDQLQKSEEENQYFLLIFSLLLLSLLSKHGSMLRAAYEIQRLNMSFREVRNFTEILKTLGYRRLISFESFRQPNFPLMADVLIWLVQRFDSNSDIQYDYSTYERRILLIKSVTELVVLKAGLQINVKNLYLADGHAVKEMLKIAALLHNALKIKQSTNADYSSYINIDLSTKIQELKMTRELALQITRKASSLFVLLAKEPALRESRIIQANSHIDVNEIENLMKVRINESNKMISQTKQLIENISSTESNLEAKINKKEHELERTYKRLETLKNVRPAFLEEYERLEAELSIVYEDYVIKFRCAAYLQQLFQQITKFEQDPTGNVETSELDDNIEKAISLSDDQSHSSSSPPPPRPTNKSTDTQNIKKTNIRDRIRTATSGLRTMKDGVGMYSNAKDESDLELDDDDDDDDDFLDGESLLNNENDSDDDSELQLDGINTKSDNKSDDTF